MDTSNHSFFHSLARVTLLGLLAATQGFAAMPGSSGSWSGSFHGGPGFGGGWGRYGRYGYHGWIGRGGYYGRYGGPRWGPGFFFPVLPLDCLTLSYGGAAWYYGDGCWYRPYGVGFIMDIPPAGLVIPVLPPDCATVTYGGEPYYCANDVYYQAAAGGYRVVAPPPGQRSPASRPTAGSADALALDALVLIPRKGQSEATITADRQAAQRFASNQTGYDPANSDPTDPGTPRARKAFLNSMKSYLEARGYSAQ